MKHEHHNPGADGRPDLGALIRSLPVENWPVAKLQNHPLNRKIYDDLYGDPLPEHFLASVRQHGVLEPLLILADGRIISGHRRRVAATEANLATVPVRVLPFADELLVEELLILGNQYRSKTNEQRARECQQLLRIEQERARQRQATGRQGQRGGGPLPADLPERGDARDLVGRQMGLGGKSVEKAVFVVETIDALSQEAGRHEEQEELRRRLNRQSIERAYQYALPLSSGRPCGPAAGRRPEAVVSVEAWGKMDADERRKVLAGTKDGSSFEAQTGGACEYARHAWNPLSGCRRGCDYCLVRVTAAQHFPNGFEPALYPERLNAPQRARPRKEGDWLPAKNVLTVTDGDLFGDGIPAEWTEAVLERIRRAPKWNFLLLTQHPERLVGREFPANAWVGITITRQAQVGPAEQAMASVKAGVRWAACEPLLEPLTFNQLQAFQWLVIGGAVGHANWQGAPAPREWAHHLLEQAGAAHVPVFEKLNLLHRRQELPR